ncbi:N-acetylmuramoyl-L-alanine amidase [Rhineura floridana]|uniref:N-acetylmuramoyl-L-alanine amidase n=1 Tax=Rhineura floridana TaxID=261503 RepID=UPI002AC851B0|nr:N-acetylmuramoyl-L-alanine amidase [Rhineura floridana]
MFLMWLLGLGPLLFCISASADNLTFHIGSVTGILEDLEYHLKGPPDLTMTELFQELECCQSELCQLFLGPVTSVSSDLPYLSEQQIIFLKHLVNHKVDGSLVEHGVVLTPDGTTVSFSPLLAGIAAGFKRRHETTLLDTPLITDPSNSSNVELHLALDPLYATTIAMDLGKAFLLFHTKQTQVALGPNGCWDSISAPQKFTLMGPPSHIPDAFINGAMDGFILGTYLAAKADPISNISSLLNDYYGGEGLEGESQIRSNFRQQNFEALVSKEKLRKQVEISLHLLWRLNETSPFFEGITSEELMFLANQAVEEFMALFVECPAIIPRCMWGARPYRGTPTQLKLPLAFVYIHHTHTPAKPCRTFASCAADMRSMQRFHQDVRGWDDIGYSFVVGGDGYMYQGRGWHWVGAHTKGYNSKGYGISFIGDYMKVLPDAVDLELVKNNFMQCAVRGAKLQANYTVYGHRQMGHTLCPGDRLFQEIETWKGFKRRCFMDNGVHRCI